MEKIKLTRDNHGDTRNAPKDTTRKQFHQATANHKKDVKNVLASLGAILVSQGKTHDWSKLAYEDEFWEDFQAALLNGKNFVEGSWYQRHIREERHHPTSYCHEDIDLLDIIEMIADCVCAGKARAGSIRPLEINDEILKKAFNNTVKLIDDITEVED